MAYTKINWKESTPLSTTNLNKMETQYDEVIDALAAEKLDGSTPLKAHVVGTFPTNSVGRIIYNDSTNKFYVGTGSAWLVIGTEPDGGGYVL